MKNNKYQQLSLFDKDEVVDALPADVMQAIMDARLAWLRSIHSGKKPIVVGVAFTEPINK